MEGGRVCPTARFIRQVRAVHGHDGDLLRRFVTQRDEASFAEIVRRHGPVVLGVCQRLLGDTPDADDAFQATFLVLARKASQVARPELLGNWLYGVAHRAGLRARALVARQRSREGQLLDVPGKDSPRDADWADIRRVLDEEVSRLPHRHRTAFVLCYFEGRTVAQASQLLGCPEGTVHSRLSWARGRLRSRLARRGLAPAAGTITLLLGRERLTAAVVSARTAATVKLAIAFTAGKSSGLVPAGAAALATYVLGGTMARLIFAAVVLAGVGVVGFGGAVATRAIGQDRPRPPAVERRVPKPAVPVENAKADEPDVSVKATAPVVVKTVPEAGDTGVDAAKVTEIRVTFSKEMADKSWSWSQISDETFPKTTGKPHYAADKRTCVLSVKLEPGKVYVIWLNPPKFQGFRDADGHAAVFYPLVFETKKSVSIDKTSP